jgi:hypothetical protein
MLWFFFLDSSSSPLLEFKWEHKIFQGEVSNVIRSFFLVEFIFTTNLFLSEFIKSQHFVVSFSPLFYILELLHYASTPFHFYSFWLKLILCAIFFLFKLFSCFANLMYSNEFLLCNLTPLQLQNPNQSIVLSFHCFLLIIFVILMIQVYNVMIFCDF